MAINYLAKEAKEVYTVAQKSGWWDGSLQLVLLQRKWHVSQSIPERIEMIRSEILEWYEAESQDERNEELADIYIRLLDLYGMCLCEWDAKITSAQAMRRDEYHKTIELFLVYSFEDIFFEFGLLLSKLNNYYRLNDRIKFFRYLKRTILSFQVIIKKVGLRKVVRDKIKTNKKRPYRHTEVDKVLKLC